MTDERIKEIVHQVLFNPQVSYPAISYKITDVGNGADTSDYTSEYMDVGDFKIYLERLEKQLISRLAIES